MHLYKISFILLLPGRLGRPDQSVLSNNRRKVLEGKGRISHEQAIEKATKEYDIFRVRQDQEYVSEFDKQTEKYFKGE